MQCGLNDQGVIGDPDALPREGELRGGPELFIPRIGSRTRINLIRYRDGQATCQVLGWPDADYGVIDWANTA